MRCRLLSLRYLSCLALRTLQLITTQTPALRLPVSRQSRHAQGYFCAQLTIGNDLFLTSLRCQLLEQVFPGLPRRINHSLPGAMEQLQRSEQKLERPSRELGVAIRLKYPHYEVVQTRPVFRVPVVGNLERDQRPRPFCTNEDHSEYRMRGVNGKTTQIERIRGIANVPQLRGRC